MRLRSSGARAVENDGGEEAFEAGVGAMLDEAAPGENGAMTEGSSRGRGVPISDPRVMRALAHPARIEIVDYLSNSGAVVTATECAGMVGLSPSAASYHLRELAKFGLVEQAPSRGDGRERVWRSVGNGLSIRADAAHPEARAAEKALIDLYLNRQFEQIRKWAARMTDESEAWHDASTIMSQQALIAPEELIALNEQVRALLEPYRVRGREAAGNVPENAETVSISYIAFPEGAP
jgi:DNA-binding transcriptional ArsR family regulator